MRLSVFFLFVTYQTMILAQQPYAFDLQGDWEYCQTPLQYWKKCSLPNSIYQILQEDKLINDPFFSNNEESIQWVAEEDWSFKKKFILPDSVLAYKNLSLEIEQLDTYAELYLNDFYIGGGTNSLYPQRFNIKPFILLEENILTITIKAPVKIADSLYESLPSKLPGEHRVCVRTPQFHYGWDFGPKMPAGGIQGFIHIKAWNDFRVNHTSVITKEITNDTALLSWTMELESSQAKKLKIKFTSGDQEWLIPFSVITGINYINLPFSISKPELWWPNGWGKAFLYHCKWSIFDDELVNYAEDSLRFGIRTISLDSRIDTHGRAFTFIVNNKALFAKGANYIPQHAYLKETKNHLKIIEDVANCNFNMLRIWGGGQYESEAFYQKCDELGILIWQDFMYACGMYPGDSIFLENAYKEAQFQVQRLSKFACMGLWCGNNENNEGWHRWGWQILLSPHNRERIWADYQKLFNELLPRIVKEFSNKNDYWESSPLFGRGDNRFKTDGDAHDWGVWHDEMPFHKLKSRVPRFMSEFGFQSLPGIQTISTFANANALDLESKDLLAHQKHPRGNKLIRQYLNWDFPDPSDFEKLVYLNQLTQAEGIGLGIMEHRAAKPYCMGTLYWQLNDCWPGISWSGRDYYGHWKALQHNTKILFEPLSFYARIEESNCKIIILNDRLDSVNVQFSAAVKRFDGSDEYRIDTIAMVGPNQNNELIQFDLSETLKKFQANNSYLHLSWNVEGNEYEKNYLFCKPSNLKLKSPKIEITNSRKSEEGWTFDIISDTFVKWLYIPEALGEHIESNFFDLEAGKPKTINWKTDRENFDLIPSSFLHLQTCLNK